jgi:hypothetical protein
VVQHSSRLKFASWLACGFATMYCIALRPPCARGAMAAWHTALPLTPNAFVVSQGSPPHGQFRALDLRCEGASGACSWMVTARVSISSGTMNRYDLWLRDAAGPSTNLSVSQTAIAGSPFSTPLELLENGPGGFISRVQAESSVHIQANENVGHFMHSFVLTQTAGQTSGMQNIIAASYYGFNGTGPGTDPGYATRFALVGDNPLIRHVFLYQEWPNPVIRITNTPEPATAALLLAPAVLLLSRRGPRDRSHRRGKKSE